MGGGRLFDFDGPVFGFFDRLSDIVILNVVFFICCLPVFTIGASLTALSSITQKMARKEEGYIVRGFFRAFRQNFRQSTVIWLIMCFLGLIFALDFRILRGLNGGAYVSAALGVLLVLSMIYFFEFIYVFPLLARFDNTLMNTMKNALLLSVKYLPWTVLLTLLAVLPYIALYYYLGIMIPVLLLGGFSLISLASSCIFKRLFDPLIKEEETS